ncbi:unnamed protein product, partial [Iphiclides podalirius]
MRRRGQTAVSGLRQTAWIRFGAGCDAAFPGKPDSRPEGPAGRGSPPRKAVEDPKRRKRPVRSDIVNIDEERNTSSRIRLYNRSVRASLCSHGLETRVCCAFWESARTDIATGYRI